MSLYADYLLKVKVHFRSQVWGQWEIIILFFIFLENVKMYHVFHKTLFNIDTARNVSW